MNHWILEHSNQELTAAEALVERAQLYSEFNLENPSEDYLKIYRAAQLYELAGLDLLREQSQFTDTESINEFKRYSEQAFRHYRVLPVSETPLEEAELRLRLSAFAVIADRGADAARLLKDSPWKELPTQAENWNERAWATILDIWLLLIRKQGWDDRDLVLSRISELRALQSEYEADYLNQVDPSTAVNAALELAVLYHLAKAAEILGHYMTDGVVDGNFQIRQLLEAQFDRVQLLCKEATLPILEPLSLLLSACAYQMAENSIWTVTRAVNSRVTKFVESLVDRGRGGNAIFDVLPPQRRALSEQGLLGSSRRAVVVSLPTSSGKTLIAQFRILQALNQFDHERGWVVYLAPTRTLVNQVARKLRRDFKPLGVVVEQVSPALEIDGVEVTLLREKEDSFRVLVTTPEKLDLMLRQGWEEEIGRPLTLVVVDEAHNLEGDSRGLKLELLLATINKECQRAQFLLLTPFIPNATEIARWLGGNNSEDISLALDWQPNDRAIGVVTAKKGEKISARSYDYSLSFDTVHTSRNTIYVDEELPLAKDPLVSDTFGKVKEVASLAAITAKSLAVRGPVIVMHARPDWVWSLAMKLKDELQQRELSDNVQLVQEFLSYEFGQNFSLVELLRYGIGVHHAGLSDEARALMEWLFEEGELDYLVATTTIAQGVNFPITGVVMASNQYPTERGMVDMPPEDFWNIAGRAGRVDQGSLGIVALVAQNSTKNEKLKTFINQQTDDLNSALIKMVADAGELVKDLGRIVYSKPEWSSFVQYLAHSYREMGKPENFADQVEQVLRGTYGFDRLRTDEPSRAADLLEGVESYIDYLQQPGQPLKLVDSTGFSLQSIKTVLSSAHDEGVDSEVWRSAGLFSTDSRDLENMMGLILRVPELRDNLEAVTGGDGPNGGKLASILKDWVNGEHLSEIARRHFGSNLTVCGQNLFGKLSQTASWGLGALLSITGTELEESEFEAARDLASQVYYGVSDKKAIQLRLLGVPRTAAEPLSNELDETVFAESINKVRERVLALGEADWLSAMGEKGKVYRKVWLILEGQ